MAKIQIGAKRLSKKPTKTVEFIPAKPIAKDHKNPTVRVANKMTGLSIKQLVKATPPYIRSNSEDVVIKALKPATTKGGLPGIRSKTVTSGKRPAEVYDTSFVGKEKGIPVSAQKHVLASCSCAWFWSHCEFALTHWGSAVIKYSNGEPATVTNPSNHPMLCKHLVRLGITIVEEGL